MAAIEILRLRQAREGSPRVTVTAAGRVFQGFTAVEIERDITNIAAGARLEFYDAQRARRAFNAGPYWLEQWQSLAAGMACSIAIDGETVLAGYVEELELEVSDGEVAAAVTIMDKAADLVECAAAPRGPAEYRNLTLLQFAQRICQPFGIPVRADVDVGEAFPLIGIEPGETALSAISKQARQRAVLVTSDGVGGLLLTRGSESLAPAPLRLGQNIRRMRFTDSWKDRHSDWFVKGQTPSKREGAKHDATVRELRRDPPATASTADAAKERAAVVMTGHATDPEVTRYRPAVLLSRTQSGGASVQEQAEWRARVSRGRGQVHVVTEQDFRAGEARGLWRPNQIVMVDDPYADIAEVRLIPSLTYRYGPDGASTEMKVVRREAFSLINEGPRRRSRRHSTPRSGDATVRSLQR